MICSCVGSGAGVRPASRHPVDLGKRLLDGRSPRTFLRQIGIHLLPPCCSLLELAFLSESGGEIEFCLGVCRLDLDGAPEGGPRIRRNKAVGSAGNRLAQSGDTIAGLAQEPDGVAVGRHGIGQAPAAQIDRREHIPAAPVIGIAGEVCLGAGDEFFDRAIGGILFQAGDQWFSGQLR